MMNHARPNPWMKLVLVHKCSDGIYLEALSFRVLNRPNLTILVKMYVVPFAHPLGHSQKNHPV